MKSNEFKAWGYYADTTRSHLEIMLDGYTDTAKTRYVCTDTNGNEVSKTGRWRKIGYNTKGEAYIMHCGRRRYLHNFLRIY